MTNMCYRSTVKDYRKTVAVSITEGTGAGKESPP
jgi:hypothetical protein